MFVLVDLARIEQALQDSLNDFLVPVARCLGPFVIFHVELLPKIDKLLRDLLDEFSWRNTSLGSGLLHLLAVLIDASKEKDIPSTHQPFMIARDHIGQHFLVSVSDVRRRVRVIDRRGDEKCLRHFAITSVAAVCDCRKQGELSAPATIRFEPLPTLPAGVGALCESRARWE